MGIQTLELRRRKLGMSYTALARRSRVSLPTVMRIFSGKDAQASFGNIAAIASALGVEIDFNPLINAEEMCKKQARARAREMVALVQGTSALEGQGLDREALEQMERLAINQIERSKAKLWGE